MAKLNLIATAPLRLDQEEATDYVCHAARFAVRVRDADKYLDRYKHQFTIRYALPSGDRTEIHKIAANEYPNFKMLYLFGSFDTGEIVGHHLIDLNVLRDQWNERGQWMAREIAKRQFPPLKTEVKSNSDGTQLLAVNVSSLAPGGWIESVGALPRPVTVQQLRLAI